MSNPTMEAQIKELLELKRLREKLDNEITQAEEAIKAVTAKSSSTEWMQETTLLLFMRK